MWSVIFSSEITCHQALFSFRLVTYSCGNAKPERENKSDAKTAPSSFPGFLLFPPPPPPPPFGGGERRDPGNEVEAGPDRRLLLKTLVNPITGHDKTPLHIYLSNLQKRNDIFSFSREFLHNKQT